MIQLHMWTIFIPYLGAHLYELYRNRTLSKRAIFSLFLLSSYGVLLLSLPFGLKICLWIPFAIYQWVDWIFSFRLGIEFSFNMLFFLRTPRPFIDSIRELHLRPFLIWGALCIGASCLFLDTTPYVPLWITLLGASALATFYLHPYQKKSSKNLSQLKFPHENYIPLSSNYPALRKTFSFLGKKKIHIPLAHQEKPHIIFIFLESFRAKNVGALNAKIPASPHFDAWAKKGLFFRNFHTTGQQTFRAFISAYFGIPGHIQTSSLRPFCAQPLRGLPQILKEVGYKPALIQSGDVSFDYLHPFFQSHGFSTILGAEHLMTKEQRFNSWGLDDATMFQYAADFLEKQTSPTFLSLFTITNHHPWEPPPHWHFPIDQKLPPYYRKFLQTFSYTDHCLGNFLKELQRKNLLEKSILFIAGDHGQTMGENSSMRDLNQGSLEEQLHVPLLILAEGRNIVPKAIDSNASFLDFLPTVLDLLEIQGIHHSLGKSLLRDIETPSYFSICKNNSEIGSISKFTKQIFSKNRDIEFDLKKDPEEQNGLSPTQDLADCKTFFQNVEAIYAAQKWAERTKDDVLYEMKATRDMDDAAWLKTIQKHPPTPILHLASAPKLTDKSFLLAPKNHAKAWHQLILTNCAILSDLSLEWISQECPEVMSLHLSHCHLMTDLGVRQVLIKCKKLHHLYLDGIEDLTDCIPAETPLHLRTCSLLWLPKLKFENLFSLFFHAQDLLDWSVSCPHFTDAQIFQLSSIRKTTIRMHLVQGTTIHDDALQSLLLSQKDLQKIHIEDFPLIEDLDFSLLTQLRCLTILDCPRLKPSLIESLRSLPLMRCTIQGCKEIPTIQRVEELSTFKQRLLSKEQL